MSISINLAVFISTLIPTTYAKRTPVPLEPTEWYSLLALIVFLVLIGGVVAGLTLGLMSIDSTKIELLKRSGTPKEQAYARKIEPLKNRGTHYLLVTLLLTNTIVNETLPVLFHLINFEGYQAVIISTVLVVIFGEIIPQSLCARHGLAIGAFFAWPVRILMFLEFIIVYPFAKLLDCILGEEIGMIYRRADIKEIVGLAGEVPAEDTLTTKEVQIVQAVLEIRDKTVEQIMTKLDDVYMLPLDYKLDEKGLKQITDKGHSRIPVFNGSKDNIVGVILVKQLIMFDKGFNVCDTRIRSLPYINPNTPLFEILHVFEGGGSHMAVVCENAERFYRSREIKTSVPPADHSPFIYTRSPFLNAGNSGTSGAAPLKPGKVLGIVTLEDVIEELIGCEILDEKDLHFANLRSRIPSQRPLLPSKPNSHVEIVISESSPLIPKNQIYEEASQILSETPTTEPVARSSVFGFSEGLITRTNSQIPTRVRPLTNRKDKEMIIPIYKQEEERK